MPYMSRTIGGIKASTDWSLGIDGILSRPSHYSRSTFRSNISSNSNSCYLSPTLTKKPFKSRFLKSSVLSDDETETKEILSVEEEKKDEEIKDESLSLDAEEKNILLKLSEGSDEEGFRKRLVDIRQIKMKQNFLENQESEEINGKDSLTHINSCNHSSVSEKEEEIHLIQCLENEQLTEDNRNDLTFRLHRICLRRKTQYNESIVNLDLQYQHVYKENSTELSELEASIAGKSESVEKLQKEIDLMKIRQESLQSNLISLNNNHEENIQKLQKSIQREDETIRKFGKSSDFELLELESELECPLCGTLSYPPIYQCDEGHIICSQCKPLLESCPTCSISYSEPTLRCKFAEKLSLKYLSIQSKK